MGCITPWSISCGREKDDASIEETFAASDLAVLHRDAVHPFYEKTGDAVTNKDDMIAEEESEISSYNTGSSLGSRESDTSCGKKRKRLLKTVAIDGKKRGAAFISACY